MNRRGFIAVAAAAGLGTVGYVLGQPTGNGAFEGCPDLGADETVCYHELDSSLTGAYLRPSATSATLPSAALSFTLVNRTPSRLETNYYAWFLHKRVGGKWYNIAPGRAIPMPAMVMSPLATHEWTLDIENAGVEAGERAVLGGGTETVEASGLGAGAYAFSIDRYVALFELVGDPLALTPTNAVVSVERDGDALLVTTRGGDREHSRPATYVLTRVSAPLAEPTRVITEQVVHNALPSTAFPSAEEQPLRDALAFAEKHDVRQVRVSKQTSARPPFGVQEPSVIEYDGQHYRIEVEINDG